MAGAGEGRVYSIFKVRAEGRTRLIVFDTRDLSLGRSPENDLAFDDPEMSRRHAVFTRTEQGCRISDLGTPNGTEVNGESVDHAMLANGDVVRIGGVEFTYAETNRPPGSLGKSVEYASQLKAFGGPQLSGDGGSTVLGGAPPLALGPDRDREAALEMYGGDGAALDLSHQDGPLAEIELDALEAAPEAPEVWELDDEALGGLDLEGPAGVGPLRVQLELEGLEGELRRALQGMAGKTIDLSRLRIRIDVAD